MNRVLLIFLSCLLSVISDGQIQNHTRQEVVDSLFVLLPDVSGTQRVDVLNGLSMELAPRNFDSSFQYAGEALALSEKLNYLFGKGVAVFNTGNSHFFNNDIKDALTKYLEAWRILEPFEPAREIGDLLYQLGSINEYVRNTKKVLNYYSRAAKNYGAIGDSARQVLTYMTLGASYYYKFQALYAIDPIPEEEALAMMDSAIKFNNVTREYFLIPRKEYPWGISAEHVLSNNDNYDGCYNSAKGDHQAARDHYLSILKITEKMADTNFRNGMNGVASSNLSYEYYYFLDSEDSGMYYVKKAEGLLKNTDRYDLYAVPLLNLGNFSRDRGRYKESEMYLMKALNVSDTFLLKVGEIDEPDPNFRLWGLTHMRHFRLGILTSLVALHSETGDFKNALSYQKKLEEEKEQQTRDELTRQIIGLETDYEDELKRKEIAGLARDNELHRLKLDRNRILFISIGGAFLVMALSILLWIQRKRNRSDRRAMVLEQKLLRAQMNPHFIFNSLYSIQNFIVTEKSEKASIYLSKFARLVRNILDNSAEEFVPLEKEISTIENYLELQQVRFPGKFEYRIDIADDIDPEILKIPPMLAQPFIENAIEHGIRHRETPGHIGIRFSLRDHTLIFEVEDDGVGRQKAREIEVVMNPEHRSMATSLTRERLANLSRKLKTKIPLEIIDLQNALGQASGTMVRFTIPIF